MENTNISKLDFLPEEYEQEVYDRMNLDGINSEMSDGQRRFVTGLIRYYKPENILELGVSAGGGTAIILNAIQDMDSKLYSVDVLETVYREPENEVAYIAKKRYPEMLNNRWQLYTGKDPSELMKKLDTKFDFCVIDTMHSHPVETINFISILPWLKDGAVVVMHDTTLYEWRLENTFMKCFAPRILLSAVCADKYVPKLPSGSMIASNIAAWQISSDTRKYSRNLFDSLYLPWEMSIEQKTYLSVRTLVSEYYPSSYVDVYDEAVRINRSMATAKKCGVLSLETVWETLPEDVIFYGAGANMNMIIDSLYDLDLKFDYEIWDQRAEKIKEIRGHKVDLPKREKSSKEGRYMIVTVLNK
ncbi:MAG: class I SAM-dependent methyltransferase, partial [Oscillospiraceae bacterium]|nr:class I SAM-dependent methyltransferase [Oscillospiraceae bacterium]